MSDKQRFAVLEPPNPQWEVPHAEAIFVMDGPQGQLAGINGAWALRKVLLVNADMQDLRIDLQHLGDREMIAINHRIISALKQL